VRRARSRAQPDRREGSAARHRPPRCNFGLAKAKYSSVESHAGTIKGKLNYVAPEYLQGTLDIRCDLWATGVVLHELLSNRRLFDAADDFATLENVRSMPIPRPSRFNPDVTRDLDDIVVTALERDPDKRWQSASAMKIALANYSKRTKELTKAQLVAWVEWAFTQKVKLREDSGVSALHEILQSGPIEEIADDVDEPSVASKLPASSAAMLERRRESVAIGASIRHHTSQRAWWLWTAIAAVVAFVAALLVSAARHG
jgi:serine/threonine-protein kinase